MIFQNRVNSGNGEADDLINRYFAPFFPLFGYTTKYLIYKPSAIFYRFLGLEIEEKHRGLMHSVLGGFTSIILSFFYLVLGSFILGNLNFSLIAIFMISYTFGYCMHLLEDSTAISGVKWFYPFSKLKIAGNLRTTTEKKDVRILNMFTAYLGVIFGSVYSLEYSPKLRVTGGIIVLVMSWSFFLFYIVKVKIS